MAEISIDEALLGSAPKDKVVVLCGGASGIGAGLVSKLFSRGAHVYFGDINAVGCKTLEEQLNSSANSSRGTVSSFPVDGRDYAAQLAMFKYAFEQHGRVDYAIFTAGVSDQKGWFSAANLNLENVQQVPKATTDVVDVNLTACLYFTRIALAYLKEGVDTTAQGAGPSRSLILLSSANGFQEAPGLVGYSASKHGIIGIVRSLRPLAIKNFGIRINSICPVATDTPMIAAAIDLLKSVNAPLNTVAGCVHIIMQTMFDVKANGQAVLIMSDRGIDTETGLTLSRPQWLGLWASEELDRLQNVLGQNTDWAQAHTNQES
ncbi:uncharacterized protein BHQ10_009268 [Talaromyces amestolkiae]|uniref:Uncharacterized protein n=1 Tax=Talaromyces amestolkiae TaxID=1196081 RepID=A0A364LBQ8_TALAM|nr:uncharacterized protein BHQ10_009268 [Talaromyces amestolkiae]RAO73256.1 hypothetical protein BHQ10_009268 [Talaromyces amestolkiae]